MKKVYLDYSATTPVDERVFEAMKPYFTEMFGNANSLHCFGRDGAAAVDTARRKIADLLKVKPTEIYFTSGGTEGDNWAIKGIANAYSKKGNHVIVSSIEHPAVLNSAKQLESRGFKVTAHAHGALFHTDAVQAMGSIPVDIKDLKVDLLTFSAHKFYGPKGIGVLYIRSGVKPDKLVCGGHQERSMRTSAAAPPSCPTS